MIDIASVPLNAAAWIGAAGSAQARMTTAMGTAIGSLTAQDRLSTAEDMERAAEEGRDAAFALLVAAAIVRAGGPLA